MRIVSGSVYLIALIAGLLSLSASAAPVLPFGVSIGGKDAVLTSPTEHFSTLDGPVASDATVTVHDESQTVIINIFPCDKDGNPVDGVQPAVLLFQGRTTGKLDETMDKQPLTAGRYIANIVSNSKTARVLFEIK